jgi:uncharacterized membrane protein YfcA
MGLVGRLILGFVVAAACTPAGVSGAFLLLPIQVQFLHVPQPAVSATNLLYNVVSTPAGVLAYQGRGRLDRRLAGTLCLGALPGASVGAILRSTWFADADRFGWLAAVVLVGMGTRVILQREGVTGRACTARDAPRRWRLTAVAAIAGTVGGIYGIGGAALIVPWLVTMEGLAISQVAGAGLVTTLATSLVGLATFAIAAVADIGSAAAPSWANGVALGLGGLIGAVVGSRLQPHVPVLVLRTVLGIAAIAAGIRAIP